jgi:hypothetical protein
MIPPVTFMPSEAFAEQNSAQSRRILPWDAGNPANARIMFAANEDVRSQMTMMLVA